MKNILRRTLRILASIPIVGLLGVGLLFLIFSVTWKGRCVGLCVLILGGMGYCSLDYWQKAWFQKIRKPFFGILIPLALLLYALPMWFAPDGGMPGAKVRNCYLQGRGRFWRFSPWNVIPEIDQLNVGLSILPVGDPFVTFAKASHMRSTVYSVNQRMEQDADFHAAGSAMGLAYRDLFHIRTAPSHYFLFLPETAEGERIPCILFLHGMGGNIKCCLWVLSQLSQQMKCAVVAPSFGMGSWDRPEGAEFTVAVAKEVLATLPIDPKKMYLMGYSNGAMGVTRAAVEAPELFQGLIYLSSVTEDEFFGNKEFLSRAKDRNILFLHGSNDERIPHDMAERAASFLRQFGCPVHLKIFDGGDHSVLFQQPEAVLEEIKNCITTDPASYRKNP
jgi:predicted esterase